MNFSGYSLATTVFPKIVISESSLSDVQILRARLNRVLINPLLYTIGTKLANCRYWPPQVAFRGSGRCNVPSHRLEILMARNDILPSN